MKPTISNAFNEGTTRSTDAGISTPLPTGPELRQPNVAWNPRKSLAAALAPMQADFRETDFGWSLELSPITAVDALEAFNLDDPARDRWMCVVSLEQSAWREGPEPMPIADVAQRLSIPVIERIDAHELVLDTLSLRQLVSLCQPTRLLVTFVDGPVDRRDVDAMNAAVEAGRSPLTAELRAEMALEVMGDRSVVLHCRKKSPALNLVAENFRHYLAALRNRSASKFAPPEEWQLERLFELTGLMTIRPIETQMFSTSIDVGINTSKERFGRPADRSLIYDIPSNTWHDEL
jgi:hypothetical protein